MAQSNPQSIPKVSVLMSVYNCEQYLRESIDSILNQTFSDFEFIIVNDGSKDGTADILKEYARKDRRIRLICNSTNLGLSFSLNKALKIAKGAYIARQDADDVSLPQRLGRQVDFLDLHPGIGVLGTWIAEIGDGGPKGMWKTPTSPAVTKWSLLFGPSLAHPSVMFRQRLANSGEIYNSKLPCAQDYELWLRLSSATNLVNVPQVLYVRRLHREMTSFKRSELQQQITLGLMQRAMSDLLGTTPPLWVVELMRHAFLGNLLNTSVKLQTVSRFLLELYYSFIASNNLTAKEQKELSAAVVLRLQSLALSHLRGLPAESNRVVWKSIKVGRWIAIRAYITTIYRFIERGIKGVT